MQENKEGTGETSTTSGAAVNDTEAALLDLIQEFEAYQADPEPIPSTSEIAQMEAEEKGQSSSPEVPSSSASQDIPVENSKSVDQVSVTEDSPEAEVENGNEKKNPDPPKVSDTDNSEVASESETLTDPEVQNPADKESDSEAEQKEDHPPAAEEKIQAESPKMDDEMDQPGSENSDQTDEPVSEIAKDDSASEPVEDLTDQADLEVAIKEQESDPVFEPEKNAISQPSHDSFEGLGFEQEASLGENPDRENISPAATLPTWIPSRLVIPSKDDFILWKLVSNLYIYLTRYIHSLFDLATWKKRTRALKEKQDIRKIILPPSQNDPVSVKVFHCGINQLICHVTTNTSDNPQYVIQEHKWEKEVEGTARIIWSELSENPEDPEEQDGYLTKKTSDSGQTTLVYQVGSCGVIGHYADSVNPSEVKEFKNLVQSLDNNHPEIFLAESPNPEINDSCDKLDIKMTDWMQRKRTENRKPSLAGGAVILFFLSLSFIQSHFENVNQAHFQDTMDHIVQVLDAEPGIQIVHASNTDVHLLKDRFARSPKDVISQFSEASLLNIHAFPFDSEDAEMVYRRVRSVLNPTPDVSLGISGGRLILSGTAPKEWIEKAQLFASSVPGIHDVFFDGLKPELPKLLSDSVKISSLEAVEAKIRAINHKEIQFQKDKSLLIEGEEKAIDEIFSEVVQILQIARSLGFEPHIQLKGQATLEEYIKFGDQLGLRRAEQIKSLLILKGLTMENISVLSGSHPSRISDGSLVGHGAVVMDISLSTPADNHSSH